MIEIEVSNGNHVCTRRWVAYEGKGDCCKHSEGGGKELHFSVVDWY